MISLLAALALALQQPPPPVSFAKDVEPILKASCVKCHKPGKTKAGLDLSTYDRLMKGGESGAAIQAGDPDKSLIVTLVSGPAPEMPEEGDPLKDDQVELIKRWIREGAKNDGAK